MKLSFATAILLATTLMFTACEKEHKCNCYSASLNNNIKFNITGKKSDAKEECSQQPVTGAYTGTDYVCNLD